MSGGGAATGPADARGAPAEPRRPPTATRAVILAGGEGTRLRPLTLARAKPVVPLLNRPFLAYPLALLAAHGVTDAALACRYRPEDVRAALGSETLGVRLRYAVEPEPLGTGGGVRHAADPGAGRLFVLNGDVLTDADLGALQRFHRDRGAAVTILLTRVPDPRAYGLVETDPDGRIRRFREKPAPGEPVAGDTINAGVYLIEPAVLDRIPAGRPVSIERDTFPALIAAGVPCFGWCPAMYWRDIGSPEAYRLAQMDLLVGRVRIPLPPPGTARDGAWLGDGVVTAGARVVPPVVLGDGVRLEPGAQVGPGAVLGAGCRVGAGARIEAAVLWERVTVGPAATVRGAVVGSDARLEAGAALGPGAVLEPGGCAAAGPG